MNILITGATSGIGKSLVEFYAQAGHSIFACGRNPEKLSQLSEYGNVSGVCFDVTDYSETKTQLGQLPAIDLAILNAGDCEYIKDATEFDAALFQRIININLVSLGYQIEALVPKLQQSPGQAQLVLMGSSASMLPLPQAEAYGASKAGLAYLADTLYLDLKNHGIDVSRISPGFIETPLTDRNHFSMPFIMSSEDAVKRIAKGIAKRKVHIAFPNRLIWTLKLFNMLPLTWWQKLITPKSSERSESPSGS